MGKEKDYTDNQFNFSQLKKKSFSSPFNFFEQLATWQLLVTSGGSIDKNTLPNLEELTVSGMDNLEELL